MKKKGIVALALVSVMSVTALVPSAFAATDSGNGTDALVQKSATHQYHGKHGSKETVAEPENAIGKDAAKEKALAQAAVTAEQAGKVKARLSQLEDGTVVYKVSFTYNGQRYSYQINATTGTVVSESTEAATEPAPEVKGKGKHKRGRRADPAEETIDAAV